MANRLEELLNERKAKLAAVEAREAKRKSEERPRKASTNTSYGTLEGWHGVNLALSNFPAPKGSWLNSAPAMTKTANPLQLLLQGRSAKGTDLHNNINPPIITPEASTPKVVAKDNPLLQLLRREGRAADKREKRAADKVAEHLASHEEVDEVSDFVAWENELRPYQILSVKRALGNFWTERPVLDASEMGLGKTRMCGAALATIEMRKPGRMNRILWLTAVSVIGDTAKELNSLGMMVVPVTEATFEVVSKAIDALYPNKQVVYITNYEAMGSMSKKQAERGVLRNYVPPLYNSSEPDGLHSSWDCLVVDEVTKLKGGANPSGPTIIWQMVKDLRVEHPHMWPYFLSGTPIENHPNDVWAYLNIFNETIFPSLGEFEQAFTSQNARGELKLNNEALYELLRSFIIRNTYESCGVEMPLMTITKLECELDPYSEIGQVYKTLVSDLALWLSSQPEKGIRVTMLLEQLLRQRQVLVTGPEFTYTKKIYDEEGNAVGTKKETLYPSGPYPKVDKVLNRTLDLVQEKNEQVVIFCCFNEPLEFLKNRFREFGLTAEVINGSTSKQTPKYVAAFQRKQLDVLLINKLSGAYGLNLQKCDKWPGGSSHMIHMDRWWNPAKERQAMARLHRMNTNAPTFMEYCHINGTVDDFMEALNILKQQYADDVDAEITMDKSEVMDMLGITVGV